MKNELAGRIAMATAHVMGLAGLLGDSDRIKGLFEKFEPVEPREPVDPAFVEETRRKMRALCSEPSTRPGMVNVFSIAVVLSALMVLRELALKAGITNIDTGEKLVDMMVAICERGEKYRLIEAINEGAGEATVELSELLTGNYSRDGLLEIIADSEKAIFRSNPH